MIKFKFLTGDINWQKYGSKWISQKCNNGEFDYYLVIELINMEEYESDRYDYKYNISIGAVSPQLIDKEIVDGLLADYNLEPSQIDDEIKVEALHSYGTYAHLWNEDGNNYKQLFIKAHREAQYIELMFGNYMDRPENMIGQTGWNLIRGQDIREFLAVNNL